MQMSDIFTAVKSLAENDQSIANSDISTWCDLCINRINTACKANIPMTTGQATTYVPAFDARYHEVLVLFSVAKYRESDGDYQGAGYHMTTVTNMIADMQRDMVLKPSTRLDDDVQQITITNTATLTYNLIMPYGSYFTVMDVYQNDVLVDPSYYTTDIVNRTITFNTLTLTVNDIFTIVYEQNPALNHAPFAWWENTGW